MINVSLGWFFKGFNKSFDSCTKGYAKVVRRCVRASAVGLAIYVGLLFLTYFEFKHVPGGFIPNQDKGYLLVNMQLPDSASVERTQAVVDRAGAIAMKTPGVKHTITIAGMSCLLNANGSNFGTMFVILDEFENRHGPGLSADAIAQRLRAIYYQQILEAQVGVFGAPPVDGLGNAGGFKLMVQDRSDSGLEMLQKETDDLALAGNQSREVTSLFTMFRSNVPQRFVDIDREKCKKMGVALSDVFNALQYNLGGYYVNDFNKFGRTWQVNIQASAPYRMDSKDVTDLKVRNSQGNMAPLGSVVKVQESNGPIMVNRYNMYPAAAINGVEAPGVSSGEAMAKMEELASAMPSSFGFEWTELSYLQKTAGNTAILIFPLCILFVFLTHSAEYESWALPLAIILIVPMGILCSLTGVWLAGMDNDIFTQIGFVVLAGLACKNAVLIVEFAKQQREHGLGIEDAAVEASHLRLRPIMMTSFAFILGVVPLVLASGAGSEMRRTLGMAVFSGMLGVTFFGIFLTPIFFNVLEHLRCRGKSEPSH